MLQLSSAFQNKDIMSLRTGAPVAKVGQPIINPNNLKIEGFYCQDKLGGGNLVLLEQDIRELLPQGFVIDDYDVLSPADDLVRLKDVLQLHFQLIGKPVDTQDGSKLGKVADFATDISSMYIQKMYVAPSVFKSLTNGQLSVDRTQVIEITDRHVLIQDILRPTPATAPASAA